MKNLHISGLNLSLLILLSVASCSVPAFGMKSSGAAVSNDRASYQAAIKAGEWAEILATVQANTLNAGSLRVLGSQLNVSNSQSAIEAALQAKIAAGGTATGTGSSGSGTPTPAAPAPTPAPTPVTPAPVASGGGSSKGTGSGTSSTAAQDLTDLLGKLPNTAGWATGTPGEAEFKKLIDDLKTHTGTPVSLAAGGGFTPADVANAVAAAEAAKDSAHAAAQGTWASEKSSLEAQLSAAQAAAASASSGSGASASALAAAQSQVASLTGERDAAVAQVASLTSDLASKETERASAVSALAAAQAEVASKETERATAAGQVAGLQSQVASKESERAAAESALAAAQAQVASLTSEKAALQAQVDDAPAAQAAAVASAVASKEGDIRDLNDILDNYQGYLRAFEAQNLEYTANKGSSSGSKVRIDDSEVTSGAWKDNLNEVPVRA